MITATPKGGAKKRRLDTIPPGSFVRILLKTTGFLGGGRDDREELAIFLGIIEDEAGDRDERRARFAQPDTTGRNADGSKPLFVWDAYRYNGGWAFGSSADGLSLLEVIA